MTDTDIVTRIQALLAKAQSTTNEHEAEAFNAKAQQLMVRHSVDAARLRRDGRADTQTPVTRTTYIQPRAVGFHDRGQLFAGIAEALRIKHWWQPQTGTLTFCGFPEDVDHAVWLFESLLIQMEATVEREMRRYKALPELDRPTYYDPAWYAYRPVHARTHRRSFITGWVRRVIQRVTEQYAEATDQEDRLSSGTALMLRDKAAVVADWVDRNMDLGKPKTTYRTAASDAGIQAGYRAGADATLARGAVDHHDARALRG